MSNSQGDEGNGSKGSSSKGGANPSGNNQGGNSQGDSIYALPSHEGDQGQDNNDQGGHNQDQGQNNDDQGHNQPVIPPPVVVEPDPSFSSYVFEWEKGIKEVSENYYDSNYPQGNLHYINDTTTEASTNASSNGAAKQYHAWLDSYGITAENDYQSEYLTTPGTIFTKDNGKDDSGSVDVYWVYDNPGTPDTVTFLSADSDLTGNFREGVDHIEISGVDESQFKEFFTVQTDNKGGTIIALADNSWSVDLHGLDLGANATLDYVWDNILTHPTS